MTTVWIYVDTSKQVGDRDHFKCIKNIAFHIRPRCRMQNNDSTK